MKLRNLPKVFYIIIAIEVFERSAFYGLQSIAVIYFIKTMGIAETKSSNIFASFSALAYAMLIFGGIIGDKIIGLRRTYLMGMIFLMSGYIFIALSMNQFLLYLGMSFIIVGNIFFKPNANTYVGRCFEPQSKDIDAGFTYFYMASNIGIFLGTLIVPIIASLFNYNIAFYLCAGTLAISLIIFQIYRKYFISIDNKDIVNNKLLPISIFALSIFSAVLISFLLNDLFISSAVLYTILFITIIIYLYIASKSTTLEARGMYVAFILWLFSIAFFGSYIQIATSLTFFALHNVDLKFFGYLIPAGVTQGLSPMFIIIISPLLSNLYIFLYKKNINYNIANKFATGIFLVGICFITLSLGSSFFANKQSQISVIWLIIAYGLFATGELLVSALGASMIVQLLPKRICGFGQGLWYLGAAIGMKLGGQIFAFTESYTKHVNNSDSLNSYIHLFNLIGGFTMVISIILFIISVPISRVISNTLLSKK